MSYIYSNAESLEGKRTVDDGKGNHLGECVSLVKKFSGAPQTSKWKMGKTVRGNKIPKGTAIATFFNGQSYNGHAAFYLQQDNDGITVIEQYVGLRKVQKRKIRFRGKINEKEGVNDGDSYSVIE